MYISVLMATYNGEKYVLEQLESLRKQTRRIDEVIIIDDHSSDSTTQIIEKYIWDNDLAGWKLIKNEKNYGWKNNFMKGLKLCTGDIIFTCDQDDIWKSFKIEEMSRIMSQNGNILLLASNYERFIQKEKKIVKVEKMQDDASLIKVPLSEKFLYVTRPGCVYGIHKELIKYIDGYSFSQYPHDAFLWRIAEMLDGLYIYNRMTINYRRHEKTATGHEEKNLSRKKENMKYYYEVIKKLRLFIENENVVNEEEKMKYIENSLRWCELRIEAIEKRSIVAWIKNLKYISYYYGIKTCFADLYMIFRGF